MIEERAPDAFIALPTAAELRERAAGRPEMKPLYNFGYVGGMGRLLAAHPRIGPAFMGLFREVMFEPGRLDRAEREMVAAIAAAAQDCHY